MPNLPISLLPAATLPLAGTEPFPLVQGGVTCRAPASALGTTISIGSTSTLAPGSAATVVNVGTVMAAILDFGIPAGVAGAAGAAGAAATIAVGTTVTLAAGSPATVNNSGSSSAATFNFGIPAGATGATGATGAPGTPSQLTFIGSSGNQSQTASHTVTENVGPSSGAPVPVMITLDITIRSIAATATLTVTVSYTDNAGNARTEAYNATTPSPINAFTSVKNVLLFSPLMIACMGSTSVAVIMTLSGTGAIDYDYGVSVFSVPQ